MDIVIKNKFFKYIAINIGAMCFGIASIIPSIYFFVINHSNFIERNDGQFWIGYCLIIVIILCSAVILITAICAWKLTYDYHWRCKQEKKEITNA